MTAHMRKSAKGDGHSKMENEVKTTMMMMMKVISWRMWNFLSNVNTNEFTMHVRKYVMFDYLNDAFAEKICNPLNFDD